MDLARLNGAAPKAELYDMAKKDFERANAIQAGAASYNLACIYALRGDKDACLKALENSKNKGSLPNADDILNDPDMAGVNSQDWFVQFMEALNEPKQTTQESNTPVEEEQSKPVVAKAASPEPKEEVAETAPADDKNIE